MFDTVDQIKKVVADSEGDQEALRVRFDEHFKYAVGEDYETPKGYEQYTSTSPQTFLEKITDGLNRAELSLQIKLPEDASERTRRQASVAELFLFGALTDIDRNLARKGEKSLREGLGYYITVRGWYTLKCVVYVRNDETFFDVEPWDPMHVTYDYDSYGLLWIARSRMATKAQIKSEYDIDIRAKNAKIIDFWDKERNSVVVGSAFGKEPEAHDRPEIPILHGSVGPMPTIEDKDHMPTLEYRGHSVYNSAIHTFEPFNRFVSELMDIHKKSIVGSIKHYSKGGQKKLAGDPHAEYMEIQLDTSLDEDVRLLELPLVPAVTAALLGILDTERQQSMLPYPLAYGGTQEPLSGRAIDRLADAQRSVYSPRTGAESICYTWLAEQLLGQFATKGKERNFQGYRQGRYFEVKVKPKQVGKGWYINAEVKPRLPRDLEGDIQTAVIATSDDGRSGPLMSKQTAREEIIQMRDPDAENDRVLQEKGMNLPPIQIRQVAKALTDAGSPEIAQEVMALLEPSPAGPNAAGGGPGGPGGPGGAGGPPAANIPPEMIQAIAQVFIDAGQQELGVAVLEALGVPLPAPSANGVTNNAVPPTGAPVRVE